MILSPACVVVAVAIMHDTRGVGLSVLCAGVSAAPSVISRDRGRHVLTTVVSTVNRTKSGILNKNLLILFSILSHCLAIK